MSMRRQGLSDTFPMEIGEQWDVKTGRGKIYEHWKIRDVFTENKRRFFLAEVETFPVVF